MNNKEDEKDSVQPISLEEALQSKLSQEKKLLGQDLDSDQKHPLLGSAQTGRPLLKGLLLFATISQASLFSCSTINFLLDFYIFHYINI